MAVNGKKWLTNEELFGADIENDEFSSHKVMEHIAWAQEQPVWDHHITQMFLQQQLQTESIDFLQFRNWLKSKPRWSPFRVEWSIFNETLQVAGQIDSIWMDSNAQQQWIIVDWKRTRQKLSGVQDQLEKQAFGRRGRACCEHLFDTPFNHYFLQQNLYAHLLEAGYCIPVYNIFLVQCHPCMGNADSFNEVHIDRDTTLCEAMVALLPGN